MILDQISAFSKKHLLISSGDRVILGLSGGPDSVLLLQFLAPLHKDGTISLIAAHLNHEWRDTAMRDEEFCKSLCAKLDIPFISKKLSDLPVAITYNGSKEEVARKARRFFFEQLAQEYNANKIALGHHAQDQQETFFIRLLRGTSLTGLVGMKPRDGIYIRPLLEQNKTDIVNYLNEQNIAYCIDETNESDAFLRNRIRKKILPAFLEVDARFNDSFSATLQRLHETENFLTEQTNNQFAQISKKENNTLLVDYQKLLSLHPVLRYRCIVQWLCAEQVPFSPSQAFFDELTRFLSNGKQQHQMHHAWKIKKTKNYAQILVPLRSAGA